LDKEILYLAIIPFIIILLFGIVACSHAKSLWTDRGSLFADHKAKEVGDIVTVIISEATAASHKSATKRAKDLNLDGGPETKATGVTNILSFLPTFGAKAKSSYKGAAATNRMGKLIGKISARVIRVLPDGNLVIKGKKKIKVNMEEEEITLSGVIRVEDISAENTILSTYIHDADIKYKGSLKLSDKERPGIITRIVSKIINFIF
jgi:flagellar L-ring protein precursor FlgH